MDQIEKIDLMISNSISEKLASIHNQFSQKSDNDYCEDCGSEIPQARRLALPHARRCVDCQTLFERENRYR